MEGWIVCTQDSTIDSGVLFVLLLDGADVSILYDLYC